MENKLIRNCDLLSFESGKAEFLTGQDILIKGKKIHSIGPTGTLNTESGVEIMSATGLLAVPGFINTHAHVPMVLLRNLAEDVTTTEWFNDYIWPMESNLTDEDVYWGAQLGIAELIENGITCVADHYFFVDRIAEAVEQSGIRANLAWAVFGHEGEEKVDQTIEFINRWQGKADGRITTWLGPHAPYTTSPEFLAMCAEKAKKNNVGIHIHVSENNAQVDLSLKEFGITPVKQLQETGVLEVPTILAHCKYPRNNDIEILAASDTGIAMAPKTYFRSGMGLAPVEDYLQHSIPVGMATDGAASNNTLDIMEQIRLMAMFLKFRAGDSTHMPIDQVLDIAFRSSAKVMHLEDQIGELKPGSFADIALLRQDGLYAIPKANPLAALVYCLRGSDVDTVLCNGKVLMRSRELLTIDRERVKKEVQSRVQRLSQRMPDNRIAFYPV